MDGKIIMKKFLILLFLIFNLFLGAFANYFDESIKLYPKDADTLYMEALSALSSSSDFKISELQSKQGYILFLYGSKFYLLTVTKRYQNQSEVKVLPQNSDFSQGSEIAKAVFNLIDNQIKTNPLKKVK